jgi:DNA-directed RNA polymerase I subunit RPA49
MLSQRHNLGMEFGTKKAKKMITSLAENAILAANKPSAATKALMTSIGENIADMPTAEELAEAAEASKPRPRANIAAKEPVDVYPIETLIDEDTLYHIDIRDWLDATKQKKGVTTTSRYVSRRIQSVIQIAEEDPTKLKVLKYMLMVIEFFQALKKSKNGKLVPSYEVLKALKHPGFMMDGIRKRFSVDK